MNLAPIGKLYRDGLIDGFQARAMMDLECERLGYEGYIGNLRFQMFHYRWGVWDGSYSDSKAGLHAMTYSMSWQRLPSAISGEGC